MIIILSFWYSLSMSPSLVGTNVLLSLLNQKTISFNSGLLNTVQACNLQVATKGETSDVMYHKFSKNEKNLFSHNNLSNRHYAKVPNTFWFLSDIHSVEITHFSFLIKSQGLGECLAQNGHSTITCFKNARRACVLQLGVLMDFQKCR